MSKQHNLFVGQKFHKRLKQDSTFTLEITKLSAVDVTFMVTGDGVDKPEEPRVIPILKFVSWESSYPNAQPSAID